LRLTVVIPTLNANAHLPGALKALVTAGVPRTVVPPAAGTVVPAGVGAIPAEIIVADCGSSDGTPELATVGGARLVKAPRGRGAQLEAGAHAASGDWLLFLHADTRLGNGWREAVASFAADPANAKRAAYFTFALDDRKPAARRLEKMVAWRCRAFALPYGDQGLLIAREFYEELGRYRDWPLMEDVEFVRRIGRERLVALPIAAVTSAQRYRRSGYVAQSLRNLVLLSLFFLRVPPRALAWLYR
jgi:rSAM/selenodomain-associated transferase 2